MSYEQQDFAVNPADPSIDAGAGSYAEMAALLDRVACGRDGKESCVPFINAMVAYCEQALLEGNLVLNETPAAEMFGLKGDGVTFMREMVRLVAYDIGMEQAFAVMDNLILSGGFRGAALLKRLIVRSGIISLYRRDSTSNAARKMLALLGEEWYFRGWKMVRFGRFSEYRAANPRDGKELIGGDGERTRGPGDGFDAFSIMLFSPEFRLIDPDMEPGDILHEGNIMIIGNVGSGRKVSAGGNLLIKGYLEGLSARAGGNLVITKCLLGTGIELSCGGSLAMGSIDGAKATAGGDVMVESVIRNSQVSAGGSVYCGLGQEGSIESSTVDAGGVVYTGNISRQHEFSSWCDPESDQSPCAVSAKKGPVYLAGKAGADTLVAVGNCSLRLDVPAAGAVFSLKDGKVAAGPFAKPATGSRELDALLQGPKEGAGE